MSYGYKPHFYRCKTHIGDDGDEGVGDGEGQALWSA